MSTNRKTDHDQAVTDMMTRLNLPESSRYYLTMMLVGSYHLGKEDAKKEMLTFLNK